jgi:hypothetical protein
MKWQVQIHGEAESSHFEISIVNTQAIDRAQRHYGWFNHNKLLITHNGGPCHWPLTKLVWDKQVKLAQEVADHLNKMGA